MALFTTNEISDLSERMTIQTSKRIMTKTVMVKCTHCNGIAATVENGCLIIEHVHHGNNHRTSLSLNELAMLVKDCAMEFEVINGGKA